MAFPPPKRTARGRSLDILNVFIDFSGEDENSKDWKTSVIKSFASTFYATSGSVTTAVRSAVEVLNNSLLQRNFKVPQGTAQITATLNLFVLRESTLIIAHAGPTQSAFISDSTVEFFTDESQLRPLGVSRTPSVTFFQPNLTENALLVFCPKPPSIWDEVLLIGSNTLPADALKRKLTSQAGATVKALFTRFVQGKGLIFRRRLQEPMPRSASVSSASENSIDQPGSQVQADKKPVVTQESLPLKIEDSILDPGSQDGRTLMRAATVTANQERPAGVDDGPGEGGREDLSPLKKQLAKAWLFGKKIKQNVKKQTANMTAKVAPGTKSRRLMSPSLMLFIAIAIPLVIVAIATTVYLEKGKAQNHQYYLGEAEKTIGFALGTEDLSAKITYWEAALSFVDQAETYGVTEASESLRDSIQQNLDMLGGMSHLSLIPLLEDDLDPSVSITKVISSLSDSSNLYLFDSANSQVLHVIRDSATSYSLDGNFNCSSTSNPILSKLADVVILPPNAVDMSADAPNGAAVMAVDESGNLLYCSPGKLPAQTSLPPPSVGWGQIKSVALDGGNLYVLDAVNNRVWIYLGSNFTFPDAPVPFFSDFVPADMQGMTQIAVNLDELFLLNENSLVTKCRYSDLTSYVSTKCDDPAVFNDLRTSSTPIPLVLGAAHLSSMQKMDIPSSSLYFLDSTKGDLYKFGIQLNLYHVFSFRIASDYSKPSNAITGFGITAEQMAVLAYGNQLYAATLK